MFDEYSTDILTDLLQSGCSSDLRRVETWLPIERYAGRYEVSDKGNVRNARTGRVLRLRKDWDGYVRAGLSKNGKQRRFSVHRLVAEAFIGPCPEGLIVNHKNAIRSDNCVENLEYLCPRRNSADAAARRNRVGGYAGKLTLEQVERIRQRHYEGDSLAALANAFGVHKTTVSRIVNNVTWSGSNTEGGCRTLRIPPDLARLIEQEERRTGKPFSLVAIDALRLALAGA